MIRRTHRDWRAHRLGRLATIIAFVFCMVPAAFTPAASHAATSAAGAPVVAARLTAPPVQAAATVVISPTTISVGETVSISGTHFQAGEPVQILLTTRAGAIPLKALRAGADGAFTVSNLKIPANVPEGSYHIAALGLRSRSQAVAALAVTMPKSAINVSPATFAPGDDIKVSGSGFAASEKVTITLATTSGSAALPIGQAQVDSGGKFGPVTLHVPFGVPAGKLMLVAAGLTSNRQVSTAVTVNASAPAISINAGSFKPGDTVTVTGTHFQPGETVNVDLVTLSSSSRLGTAQVNQSGAFTLSNVKVPANTPEGTVSVVATGGSSRLSATSQIKIAAAPTKLTINIGSVKPGDTVKLSGNGFIPGETVSIQLSGGKLPALTLANVVAGTDGSFSAAGFTVPGLVPAGTFTITASGQSSGRTATVQVAVQAPPPAAPIISILDGSHKAGTPFQLSPGGLVQLAGSNFQPGAKVTIVLVGNNISVTLGTISAGNNGTVGPLGLTVPANTPTGAYTLQVQVSGNKVASVDASVVARTPHITINPPSLSPNTSVTVQASGFAPGEQVVLALNGAALTTKPLSIMADTAGNFTATFVVPDTVLNGANTVTAAGAASRSNISVTLQAHLPFATRWFFPAADNTSDRQTAIAMLNATNAPATVKMTFLYAAGPEHTSTQVVQPHSQSVVDVSLLAGAGRRVSVILEADRQISAQSIVTYGGGDMTSTVGASGPTRTWYLAEGYTNGTFTENIAVMNPDTGYATIDVRFLPFNNLPIREERFVMQPRSNILINAGLYMPRQSIAAIVTSDKPVVVERTMRFGASGRGAHDKVGITTASSVWMFAEAQAAPDRQTFFTVLNPNQAAPAAVTATFFDKAGKPVGTQTIVVNALHRGNIKLNDVLPNAEVAAVLTSNVPVVIERPLYQGPANLAVAPSGSVIFGRNGGGMHWAFPYGSNASGDQTQLYLFNPVLKTNQIHITFYTATGASVSQDLTLAPNSGSVFNASNVSGLPSGPFGAVLTSTNGQLFIAEESILSPSTNRATSTQGIAQ